MNINERIDYCAVCNKNTYGELKREPMTEIINEKVVSYIGEVLICSKCGERMYTKEVLDYNKKAVKEAYNRLIEIEKEKRKNKEKTKEKPVIKCGIVGEDIVGKAMKEIEKEQKRNKWTLIGGIGAGIMTVVAVVVGVVKKKRK